MISLFTFHFSPTYILHPTPYSLLPILPFEGELEGSPYTLSLKFGGIIGGYIYYIRARTYTHTHVSTPTEN